MATVQCSKPDEVTIHQEKAHSASRTHAHNHSGDLETEKGHKASPGKTEKLSKAIKEKKSDDHKKDKKEKKSDEHKKDKKEKKSDEHKKDKKEKKSDEHKKEKKEKKCHDNKKEKSHDKKKCKDGKSSDGD